ncbi:MAG: diguanylate phosphodiesterase [Gammaproteobacteria bacterium]|nr:MAG: diguanylate phosphodiesterase [Gammaproteobacteria bacterium]PHR84752.1 MAG: diguanylate phosphodiesterase [Colwellia sp.]
MKLLNHIFTTIDNLNDFIEQINTDNTIFIQVLCGDFNLIKLQSVLDLLTKTLPLSNIIGSSTAGEICNGVISRKGILISLSLFEDVKVNTYYFPISNFESGAKAANKVIQQDTKACILFSEGLNSDPESFLDGFSSINKDVILAGGNAGDNFEFNKTFVIKGNKIFDDGVVLASLTSHNLVVFNQYTLEWTPVGREMLITKADKNIIYEIDNKPIVDVFSYYLGADAVKNIPKDTIEFPLIKVEGGISIARSMVGETTDGGFIFAGHLKEGDKVKFAIGNFDDVIVNAQKFQLKLTKKPIEATYIYSCSVRDLFLKEHLNYEFGLIEDIAPTSGFFTYGEYFHTKEKTQLLNISTTALSLSETNTLQKHQETFEVISKSSILKSLTHLANTTQKELNTNISFLAQYKSAMDRSSIVSKTDKNGIIIYVNDNFCEISGYSKKELMGANHNIIRHPSTPDSLFKVMWSTIKSGEIWRGTYKNISKSGEVYHVKTVISPIFDDGHIIEYIAVRIDITDIIKKDAVIRKSLIDSLTGLYNRRALLNKLEEKEEYNILVLMNLDRFSEINDYFGYDVGDQILVNFSLKLKKTFENNKNIFRLPSDDYAVIIKPEENIKDQTKSIALLIDQLTENSCKLNGHNISIDVSFGVAYGQNSVIYRLAHIALKEAKSTHRKFVFFNDEQNLINKIKNNINIINTIKSAIKDNRITPYYQGIVDNKTKKIVKYESLIRLIKKEGTVLSPFFFLEQSKKAKNYQYLTRIMITKTFETFVNLDYDFSINLTYSDIHSKETMCVLRDNLIKHSCGERLILEIVESEGIEHLEEVTLFIQQVKQYGCKIAIDDFGSGYSNFSYLAELDIDFIKIDGSLIQNIDTDANKRLAVESILYFAKNKGIKTIAEFVETESVFNIIVELGIDYSQGYLFSKPQKSVC